MTRYVTSCPLLIPFGEQEWVEGKNNAEEAAKPATTGPGSKRKKKKKAKEASLDESGGGEDAEGRRLSQDEWMAKLATESEEAAELAPKAPERKGKSRDSRTKARANGSSSKARSNSASASGPTSASSATEASAQLQRFRAPKDTVVGPSPRRNKRFACCAIL